MKSNEKNRGQTEENLKAVTIALKKTKTILKATQHTEHKLTEEAGTLIQTLKESVANGDALYSIITEKLKTENVQRQATRDFQESANEMLDKSLGLLSALSSKSKQHLRDVKEVSADNIDQEER